MGSHYQKMVKMASDKFLGMYENRKKIDKFPGIEVVHLIII